ncbi:MAG TPA: M67 family metallopeptidase [Thermoanaerobaculia bacterium]|nr:M67 family metallopeptidase [Thermoanaerobaculia bacterium]
MILPKEIAESIARFARESYPYECCGALLGTNASVTQVLAIANSSDEPKERRFRIRPQDFQHAERLATQEQLELLGFYHSHPDHPARPSAYDLEHAWPNLIYVILSIDSQQTGELTAWLLSDDRSRFEPVEIRRGEPDGNHNFDSHTAAALHE